MKHLIILYQTLHMKYVFALVLASIILFIGCNTGGNPKLFSPESLLSEQFSISTDKDTTLQTKNGALLKIPKGALSADGGIAKLEIKEAYSIQQMIKAGLVTNANGEPLSSGGMIYINAAGGQKITFNQPIKVALPADYLAKDMQLFKGEKDENGNINWTDPVTLPENKQLTTIDKGKMLFESKCASCHILGKPFTAPDLAHFMKRFPLDFEGNWRYYGHPFIDNHLLIPPKADSSYSGINIFNKYEIEHNLEYYLYTCNMDNWSPAVGQVFSNDSSNYMLDLYKYIQNESDRLDLPMPSQAYLKDCIDSCIAYNKKVTGLKELKNLNKKEREELVKENGTMVRDNSSRPQVIPPTPPPDFEQKVSPQNHEAEYYQFTIETFGWYNIDILLKDIDGVKESELFVRIIGEYRQKVEVYLIIPSLKVYGEGGLTGKTEDEYAFDNKNGTIPLPQNAKAYILAMTETKGSIAFALKEFTTTGQQSFEIALQESTMEKFNAAIESISLDKFNLKVSETKNANEIRKTDFKLEEIEKELKNAEGFKPKGCNCDCLQWPDRSPGYKAAADSSTKVIDVVPE
jgi:hypothetical protein